MHSILLGFAVTGLASFAHAYTKPTTNTWGPLLTPDLTSPVTQGETYKVTWDPEDHDTDGVTVSLVLCHGPSSNCVPFDDAIVEGVPAARKFFDWTVPSDLAPGKQATDTGYGMLIIVDGTGEFQYSTQFSVLAGKGSSDTTSSSKPSTTSAPVSSSTNSGIILEPPVTTNWDKTTTASTDVPHGPTKSSAEPLTTASGGPPGPKPTGDSFTYDGTTYTTFTPVATTSMDVTAAGATSGTTTATASQVSASSFEGGAPRLGSSMAGLMAVAGFAVLAL
ncbi:hypothetical protein PV10_04967 [Exophiala mesophila]|uniref:Yeast cell wall synthesis Kre9/Knh1-like N-terminal domain-containing protein n=1 Tax=Exophiala mesophila TaxID=212818 RepID=A0A0D1ZIM8_EXOME|nr:uncharacterized protein PV10_04967 [Exophiala mesophila]KIV93779.1 hypothetical protein PV10_04967 [Exophiala mesophila]